MNIETNKSDVRRTSSSNNWESSQVCVSIEDIVRTSAWNCNFKYCCSLEISSWRHHRVIPSHTSLRRLLQTFTSVHDGLYFHVTLLFCYVPRLHHVNVFIIPYLVSSTLKTSKHLIIMTCSTLSSLVSASDFTYSHPSLVFILIANSSQFSSRKIQDLPISISKWEAQIAMRNLWDMMILHSTKSPAKVERKKQLMKYFRGRVFG